MNFSNYFSDGQESGRGYTDGYCPSNYYGGGYYAGQCE